MDAQSVITRTVSVAGGRFAPGHLGELTQLIPFEMVDEALKATGRVQVRLRDLPSRVVVYLLLAACRSLRWDSSGCGASSPSGWPACR